MRMVRLGVYAVAVGAVLALLPGSTGTAQQRAAAFPVIVVFNNNAPFESFRGSFRADARAAENPAAWDYLDRGVAGLVQTLEARQGFQADHVYSHALRGFAARLTARQIQDLENDPTVALIEADGTMTAIAQTLPWGIDKIDADISSTLAGNGSGAITNVNSYIIDTGIDTAHTDLNVVGHVNFAGGPNKDCHGHGTHVAGTVAAKDNAQDVVGVAPGAPQTGVRVLGCSGSGSTSGVIKGVDWVTANAKKPAVANMSLGGGVSSSLDTAVQNSANSGVFYVLAAGNSGADACNSSPARAGAGTNNGIMTVAATDSADKETSWSNYGACVDIWAPGLSILSTRKGGGTTTMSGTSMASPHGAGGGALYLSNDPLASPSFVESKLKGAAT
ncbi:MAG TPA: S8 family peptidase, partial [Vicinamibacterales bacterium]|nr:S8 family peptidase [Vicinamibacterales bacterium]